MEKRFLALLGMIVLGVLLRWLPHPPNFSPVASVALFGGAYFANKKMSLILPLIILFLSDLVLGLHSLVPVVYGCFVLTAMLGWQMRKNHGWAMIATQSLASAVLFFVVTNFAVWALEPWYSKDFSGLTSCFALAIPFFAYNVLGNLVFSGVLFGAWKLAEKHLPVLKSQQI